MKNQDNTGLNPTDDQLCQKSHLLISILRSFNLTKFNFKLWTFYFNFPSRHRLNSPRKTVDYVGFGIVAIVSDLQVLEENNCLGGGDDLATERWKKTNKIVHSTIVTGTRTNKNMQKVWLAVNMMGLCVFVCKNTCIGDVGTLEGRSMGSLMHSESLPSGLCCIGCGGGCYAWWMITKFVAVSCVNRKMVFNVFFFF